MIRLRQYLPQSRRGRSGVGRDIDAQRAEAGVITHPHAGTELKVAQARRGRGIDRARIDEGHERQRSVEQPGAHARFQREFGERTAAGRIAQRVLRPDLLVAIAAHRTAAAGIKPARRRNMIERRSLDRAQLGPRRDDDAFAHRLVITSFERGARICCLYTIAGRNFG